VIGEDQIKMSD